MSDGGSDIKEMYALAIVPSRGAAVLRLYREDREGPGMLAVCYDCGLRPTRSRFPCHPR